MKTPINNKEKAIKTKDEYIESLASELKEWSAQIDLLAAKTENAEEDVKLKYAEELNVLRAKQQAAAEKMKELEEASDDAWETVKETADKVWNDLRARFSWYRFQIQVSQRRHCSMAGFLVPPTAVLLHYRRDSVRSCR